MLHVKLPPVQAVPLDHVFSVCVHTAVRLGVRVAAPSQVAVVNAEAVDVPFEPAPPVQIEFSVQ